MKQIHLDCYDYPSEILVTIFQDGTIEVEQREDPSALWRPMREDWVQITDTKENEQ